MMLIKKKSKKALSMVEVIIWIFIFSIWLTSIYMTMSSSMNIWETNKNEIIATWLAREWMDLVKNLRDSNYQNVHPWNFLNPNSLIWFDTITNYMETWTYYKVEPDFSLSSTSSSVKFDKIINFGEWKEEVTWKMKNYELCLDSTKRYTYDCSWSNVWSKFFRYVKIEELKYKNSLWNFIIIKNAYKVIVKVIWYRKWYHEISLTTILADYKKL